MQFCATYPSSPDCLGQVTTCETCHLSTEPASWNPYGIAVLAKLGDGDFDTQLSDVLIAIEDDDADGDEVGNLDEILIGTNPGNADSLWLPPAPPEGPDNRWYEVGDYDRRFAYRRASTLYCGYSPSYDDMRAFEALDADEQSTSLHETLALCLDATYWTSTGLRELADPRVRPIYAVGADTDVQFAEFRLVLADYDWDYRLWRYILSDDRDIRQLLTADYHVEEDAAGDLVRIDGVIEDPRIDNGLAGGQPLEPQHRAGMLTTQWFLVNNTMFSELPRTAAAAAYRGFLGMDISRNQGIMPVAGEPLDIDGKGVSAPTCAVCHSTLDPLAYAFAYYHGIEFPYDNGRYDPERPTTLIPAWDPSRQQSVVLGRPVASVPEWGRVASESVMFRRAMAGMFFAHALGRDPGPAESDDLAGLIDTMDGDAYSANRLIHRIVDTPSFGAP